MNYKPAAVPVVAALLLTSGAHTAWARPTTLPVSVTCAYTTYTGIDGTHWGHTTLAVANVPGGVASVTVIGASNSDSSFEMDALPVKGKKGTFYGTVDLSSGSDVPVYLRTAGYGYLNYRNGSTSPDISLGTSCTGQ